MTIKITTLLLSSILLISCNYEKEISVEDAKFDKYFFNEGNIPVVNGKVLNLNPDEIDDIKVPVIVRLQGTNAKEGKELIDNSGLKVHSAITLQEAADLVKELV